MFYDLVESEVERNLYFVSLGKKCGSPIDWNNFCLAVNKN